MKLIVSGEPLEETKYEEMPTTRINATEEGGSGEAIGRDSAGDAVEAEEEVAFVEKYFANEQRFAEVRRDSLTPEILLSRR